MRGFAFIEERPMEIIWNVSWMEMAILADFGNQVCYTRVFTWEPEIPLFTIIEKPLDMLNRLEGV